MGDDYRDKEAISFEIGKQNSEQESEHLWKEAHKHQMNSTEEFDIQRYSALIVIQSHYYADWDPKNGSEVPFKGNPFIM